MAEAQHIITDRTLVQAMHHALTADAARRAGVAEVDIERSLFQKWRVERAGGAGVVTQSTGRMARRGVGDG